MELINMGGSLSNNLLICFIVIITLVIICFIFKKDKDYDTEVKQENIYSISYLKEGIRSLFNEIINQNIAELYLNKKETKKREQQKIRLNTALRSCAQGNIGEKEFVKDYIKDLLQNHLQISGETIDLVIPFSKSEQLSVQDKFEILLYIMKRQYYNQAFAKMCEICGFDMPKKNEYGTYYEITREDIEDAYLQYRSSLRYLDKLEILSQRIYQETYGFSVIDEIRDMCIDGISGGVSGVSSEMYDYMEEVIQNDQVEKDKTYDGIWVFLHGKAIHLSFLSFGKQSELIRVCKNLYRHDNVGHLTSSNGYKLTYLYDGSRVVVVRPKLASHWAFFLRKFDSSKHMSMDMLIKDKGKENVIELMKWMVKGCLNIILSGDQNSGKTTALKAMVQFIDQRYPIRTTEQEFELALNNRYPHMNVVAFRSCDEVGIIDSINIQKKTDAAIMILGEVASMELANAFITLTQAGTKSTLCTCHCVTTKDLIDYFRNAALGSGTFSTEMIAEEQVANSINIDIHWEKSGDGHRYISHITEIEPDQSENEWPEDTLECIAEGLKRLNKKRAYELREIIRFEDGEYLIKNSLSDRLVNKIMKSLSEEERERFITFHNYMKAVSNI